MNEEENILDSDEIVKSNLKRNTIGKIIGIGFLISIPINLFLVLQHLDPGFFLPRNEFIDSIIPKRLNYIESGYEIRCLEGVIWDWVAIYFGLLGLLNITSWKNNNLKKIRISHAIITIGLSFIFFTLMLEDDIYHDLQIRDPIGRQQYENKVGIFYKVLLIWIIIQFIYFILFFGDKVYSIKKN